MPKKQNLIIPLLLVIISIFIYAGFNNRAEAFTIKNSGESLTATNWNGLYYDFLPTTPTSANPRIVNDGLKLRLDGGTADSGELQLQTDKNNGNHWAIYSHVTDGNLNFWYGGNLFIINTNGDIEIGESNLSDKLIVSTNVANGGITLDGSNAPAFKFSSNGMFKSYLGLATINGNFINQASVNDTIFRTENTNILFSTDSGASTTLTLKSSNGNIGIGTANPNKKLDVNGSIYATGNICDGSGACLGGGGDWAKGANINNIYNTNNGNVGIGIAAPTEKLDVSSGIKADKFCIGSDCTDNLSFEVIKGGFIPVSSSNFPLGSGWSLVKFYGTFGLPGSTDFGAAGGFIYKLSNGTIEAALFSATASHNEFVLGTSDSCSGASYYALCAKKDLAGNVYISTGSYVGVSYVIIK